MSIHSTEPSSSHPGMLRTAVASSRGRFSLLAVGTSAIVAVLALAVWWPGAGEEDSMAANVLTVKGALYGNSAVLEANRFTSLESMARSSDVVVIGSLGPLSLGREFGREGVDRVYNGVAELEVSEVLGTRDSSAIRAGDRLAVEFFVGAELHYINALSDSLEGVGGIWFLTDKEATALGAGATAEEVAAERGYYRLISSQGLVVQAGDRAVNVFGDREDDTAGLIDATNGLPFADVRAATVQTLN